MNIESQLEFYIDVQIFPSIIFSMYNAGAVAPPVIFFCPLSFSSGFDRGTYKPYISLCICEEKFRGQKNITQEVSESRLIC